MLPNRHVAQKVGKRAAFGKKAKSYFKFSL